MLCFVRVFALLCAFLRDNLTFFLFFLKKCADKYPEWRAAAAEGVFYERRCRHAPRTSVALTCLVAFAIFTPTLLETLRTFASWKIV